jgi:hypothetical protein
MTKAEFETILSDLTSAKNELNRLHLEMQTARAKSYLEIKKYPGKYGLEKATENSIEAIVNTNTEIIELENKIIEAKHKQSVCFAKYDLSKYEIDMMKSENEISQNGGQ